MELKTCPECRRLFNYLTGDVVCPECKNRLEEEFCVVKEYITEHTGARMAQVAKDCEIALSQIKQWIREEKIHLSDEQEAYSSCERCGRPIPIGQFCNICQSQLLHEVENALKSDMPTNTMEKPKREEPKIRFLDHRQI